MNVLVAYCALAVSTLVSATEPESLEFAQLLGLATQSVDVVAGERAYHVLQDGIEHVSGVSSNPQIQMNATAPMGDQSRGLNWRIGLAQNFSLSGQGGHRREALAGEADVAFAQVDEFVLERKLGAASAWIDLWLAQQLLDAAKNDSAAAEKIAHILSQAAKLGEVTLAEAAFARGYASEAATKMLHQQGLVIDAQVKLNQELQADPLAVFVAAGDLPMAPVPENDAEDAWLARASESPAVRSAALRVRSERLRLVEDRSSRGWVLGVGADFEHDIDQGYLIGTQASLQMPMFEHGQREATVRAAEITLLETRQEESRRAVVRALRRAFHETEHTRTILNETIHRGLPAAEESAQRMRRVHDLGESTLLELLSAERMLAVARGEAMKAQAAHAWARIHVWLLLQSLSERKS